MAAPACAAVTAASIVAHRVYGRTHRAGLIVGIHAASLRPHASALLRPAPKPRRAWRASNVGVAWPGRAGPSRRPIIRVIPESAGILVPHVFVLCSPGAGDGCPRCRRPALQSGLWRRLPFAGGALGQAEHVFLRGNGLPERWRGRDAFTVCETGFGLGLNFLALWRAWRDDPARARCCTCWRSKAIPSLWRIWLRCWRATRPGRWPAWRASWRPNGRCRCLACTGSG